MKFTAFILLTLLSFSTFATNSDEEPSPYIAIDIASIITEPVDSDRDGVSTTAVWDSNEASNRMVQLEQKIRNLNLMRIQARQRHNPSRVAQLSQQIHKMEKRLIRAQDLNSMHPSIYIRIHPPRTPPLSRVECAAASIVICLILIGYVGTAAICSRK